MITGTTTAFNNAVVNEDAVDAFQITINVPGTADDFTLVATKVQIDASLVSDLPGQARLQVGYPQVAATFTLAGAQDPTNPSFDVSDLFSPWSTTSALYQSDALNAPVTVSLGLFPPGAGGVPELVRKFTGLVDSYTLNADGSVDFSCVDNAAVLRGAADIPAVVTAAPYNAGLTSEFAVDHLLRSRSNGTISSWPPPRPSCVFAVGLRGSLWPETGSLVSSDGAPVFSPGAYGTALSDIGVLTYSAASAIGGDFYLQFLVTGLATVGGSVAGINIVAQFDTNNSFYFYMDNTQLSVTMKNSSSSSTAYTWTRATDATAHFVTAKVHAPVSSTTWTVTFTVDAASNTSGTNTNTVARSKTFPTITLDAGLGATLAGVQFTTETAPVSAYPYTPTAVFDPSLNDLTVIPAVTGDAWATIQQIADAELAVAGFDESGIFRFYNRATIRDTTLARTVTSTDSLASLAVEQTAASVVNRAQIGYANWQFGAIQTVWSAGNPWLIPRHGSVTISPTTVSLVGEVDGGVSVLPNGWAGTSASYYRASVDPAGTAEHTNLTFVVSQSGSDKLQIVVTNPSSSDAWLVSPANYTDLPAGTPVLRIAGVSATQADTQTVDFQWPPDAAGGAASSRFGEVIYAVSDNPWIQDVDSATKFATAVVEDMYIPRPNLTNIAIVPDPRLQLTDTVLLSDPDVSGVNEYAYIFGWSITYGDGETTQTVDARTIAPPGAALIGVAGRSEIGSTFYIYSQ